VIVKAALGAGFGITPRPDAEVESIDRLARGERLLAQESLEGRHIEFALRQGGVEAAPAPPVGGVETEVDRGGHWTTRAERVG
jgi:hypothetical protein